MARVYGAPPLTVRPRLAQLTPQLVVGAVALAIAGSLQDRTLVVAVLLGIGYLVLIWRTHGTHLTDDELVLLGLRNRAIRWTEVATIREQRAFGGRGLLVEETSGRRALLPAPRDSRLARNRDYESERDAVLKAWEHGRDESWRADAGSLAEGPADDRPPER
jgi:hypothetical protein